MKIDIGLGFFKGRLAGVARGLGKEQSVASTVGELQKTSLKEAPPASPEPQAIPPVFSPNERKPTPEFEKPLDLQPDVVKESFPSRPAIPKEKIHPISYNRILRQIFGKLDIRQKDFFARLFPTLNEPHQRFEGSAQYKDRKMRSYIQFLTTPTADTSGTCLLLHFDDKRYLVGNIHEGLQRAGIQFGAKFTRVQDIFVTGRTEWKTTGGLLGMVLTLADSTNAASEALVKEARNRLQREKISRGGPDDPPIPSASDVTAAKAVLNVHGGPNLMHLFATARMFIFRKGVPLEILEDDSNGQAPTDLNRKPDWADDNIQVWNMAITPTTYALSPKPPRKRSFTEFAEPESTRDQVDTKPDDGGASPRKETEKHQEIRKHVVSEMFHSSWRLDNLEEVPLSSINGPAALFIRNSDTNKLERYYPPSLDENTPLPDINVLVRKKWPGAKIDELPKSKPSPVAMSYIIRNHRQRGKFMTAKAKELNVPMGPLCAKLVSGLSVQSMDGKTITPEMVLAEGKEGGGVAVIDLPDIDYVESLINRSEWNSEGIMAGVGAVLWLLGTGVVQDHRLRTFMNDHPQWKHIISSPDYCPNYLAMSSSASAAIRLSQVNKHIFPLPVHDNNLPPQRSGELYEILGSMEGSKREDVVSTQAIPAQRGLMCQLEPSFEIQETAIVPFLDTASLVECMPKKVLRLARTAREKVATDVTGNADNQELPSGDAEIVTLGTGSALPSKYRNVSATLLRVPGCGSYLLDCGENTLGQLNRVYGEAGVKDVLRDLKLIWISHLHADHHLGTVSVIKAWRDAVHGPSQWSDEGVPIPTEPKDYSPFSAMAEIANPVRVLEEGKRLFVTGTGQMMKWLKEYADVEDFGYDTIVALESVAPWTERHGKHQLKWHQRHVGFTKDYPMMQVPHCWNAQAVSLTFPTGFKFSYSGDCRPSLNFAKIGRGSTVLLHEATFDDELQGDAEAKKHSTTSEAIGVGIAMGARRVILTHFSQRYQKIPVMDNLAHMHVKLEDTDENAESDIPFPDIESSDTVPEALPEDVVRQDRVSADADVSSELTKDEPSGEHLDEPEVEATGSRAIYKRRHSATRSPSRPPSQSESEVVIAPEVAKNMKICVAFDYMRIRVKEIAHMEEFTPALLELYQQDDAVEEGPEKGSDAVEKKKKREDESDDEFSRGNRKNNNEEINRGKSKKQNRRELRENEQSEKGQGEGKGNAGAGNTASLNPGLGLLPLKGKDSWECVFDYPNEQRDERLATKKHRRIDLQLALLKDNHKRGVKDLDGIYNKIIRSIAYTTFATTGKISEFLKVLEVQGELTRPRALETARKLYFAVHGELKDKSIRKGATNKKEQRKIDAALKHEAWLIQKELTSNSAATNEAAPIKASASKAVSSKGKAAPVIRDVEKGHAVDGSDASKPWESMQDRRTASPSRRSLAMREHQISSLIETRKSKAPIIRKHMIEPQIASDSGSLAGWKVIDYLRSQPDTPPPSDLFHQSVSVHLPMTSMAPLQPVVSGLQARYIPAEDKNTLIPTHDIPGTSIASTQPVAGGPHARYQPADNANPPTPTNKAAQDTKAATSGVKRRRETAKAAASMVATPKRSRVAGKENLRVKTKPQPKRVEHLSWDVMLADVAKEVEADLQEPGRSA